MKKLKSGYTTGACAAAAAKASVLHLFTKNNVEKVEIPFPDCSRITFKIVQCRSIIKNKVSIASVKKDAGDDPDVTNGAIIDVEVSQGFKIKSDSIKNILIKGGIGIGVVTKKGLAVPVGEPAINPVPRMMIEKAITEGLYESGQDILTPISVTVSIANGEELAKKTLNKRLGIVGGLSILGTTGIVKPISAKAWTDTISTSMDVAKAAQLSHIILSTGRTSEKAVSDQLGFPEEALIMMGDYLKYSLEEARNKSFSTIYLAGMWAKILKCAMGIPQTHVRNGALDVQRAIDFIQSCNVHEDVIKKLKGSNTAREIYGRLLEMNKKEIIHCVCMKAKQYGQEISGLTVYVYLVDAAGSVVEKV